VHVLGNWGQLQQQVFMMSQVEDGFDTDLCCRTQQHSYSRTCLFFAPSGGPCLPTHQPRAQPSG